MVKKLTLTALGVKSMIHEAYKKRAEMLLDTTNTISVRWSITHYAYFVVVDNGVTTETVSEPFTRREDAEAHLNKVLLPVGAAPVTAKAEA